MENSPGPIPPKKKNPWAVKLGRLGGLKGGKARAKKLGRKKLQESARKAIKARWDKYRAAQKEKPKP